MHLRLVLSTEIFQQQLVDCFCCFSNVFRWFLLLGVVKIFPSTVGRRCTISPDVSRSSLVAVALRSMRVVSAAAGDSDSCE